MNYSFFDFLQLIGSLGIFIFGMKIFSEGLQKIAGERLKDILSGMTRNRFTGLVTGFGATAITQSSTTITVMVVSFVNAGLLTFVQSTGVVMGANIGTTLTAWMVALFGFKFQITPVALAIIGIFFAFIFSRNSRLRSIAETMVGFGILFIGLEFVKGSVPDINSNPGMLEFLHNMSDYGYLSLLIFIVIGALLTVLTQSSTAATAITLVMLFEGWISFPIAAAMVLGENVGTTMTANIAAMVANVHAKRTARFHFVINIIGVMWMLVAIYPVLHAIDYVIQYVTGNPASIMGGDVSVGANATIGLSLFHTAYNVMNMALLFAFVPYLVRFTTWIVPDKKGTDDEDYHLRYISSGPMKSPGIAIAQANKEIQHFTSVIGKMHDTVDELIFNPEANRTKLLEKIRKYEEATDEMEIEISDYLVRVSEHTNLEHSLTERMRFMQTMVNDLERIADIYYQLSKITERLHESRSNWPDDAASEMQSMMNAVKSAVETMQQNTMRSPSQVNLDAAIEQENAIDECQRKFRDSHYERLENGNYPPRAGVRFMDMLNRLERIGDHIFNVNEAAAGRRLKAMRIEDDA